jgi:hypothetical protein
MHKPLPMHLSPRCNAHARTTGRPCRNGSMANGRCRMHGGQAGAPKGNQNARKHGEYSGEAVARRAWLRSLSRNAAALA